jgi:hypothetical protein
VSVARDGMASDVLQSARDPLLAGAALFAHRDSAWEDLLFRIAQLDACDSLVGLEHAVRAEHLRRQAAACMKAAL